METPTHDEAALNVVLLTQQERMQVISVLPQQGDIHVVRAVRLLRDYVNLKPEERPRVAPPGQPQIQAQPIPPKEFRFTKTVWELIAGQLKILEKEKKLPVDYLELYEKFVEMKKESDYVH